LFLAAIALPATAQQNVTFYRDVLSLLQERCQTCHRPGEVGPMPLLSYDQARPWAKAIKEAVTSRKMPPWNVEAPAGKFHNDPSLSARQIEMLALWADNGAPAGDPKDAPKLRTFAEGWTSGTPDIVFEMPEAYQVPASGTIEYTYVIVPTGFKEDRWISIAEVRPGNRAVVHHANVYVRDPGSPWLRDYPAGKFFVPNERGQRSGPGGVSSAGATLREQVIAGYIPGRPPKEVPPGYGLFVPAGSDLIFQLHYTATGKAATDRTRVGFTFARTPPTKRVIRIQASNGDLLIPPGASDHAVAATSVLGVDCELLDAYPHMHLRGKSMTISATYPTGQKEELVRVPRYDFNWQLVYEFKEPLKLPKGTLLHANGTFDNSANNKFNPDPKAEVRWGDQTWEEMMVGFFDVAVPVATDLTRVAVKR
jgi:hypothetical protein